MQMLGAIAWMLLLGNGLLPLTTAHVCDTLQRGTRVCDPASSGAKYFVCWSLGRRHAHLDCPPGLVFNNGKQACDWLYNTPKCDAGNQPTDPTTTTTTTTPPPMITKPTTPQTATSVTTNPTKGTPITTKPTTSATTTAKGVMNIDKLCVGVPNDTPMCDPATSGTTFIRCLNDRAYYYICPEGTLFNQEVGYCDWPANIKVMCVAGDIPTRQPQPSTPAGTTTTTTLAPYPTGQCNASTCQLPDCRCVGVDIPGNLTASDVPQMVLLTFDDGINGANFHYYEDLFPEDEQKALKNPNQCRTAATFFVSNDANEMNRVRKLWNQGHEMASHSLTHSNPINWSPGKWEQEMQGMRTELAKELGTPVSEIGGMRTPYLELGGQVQFSMMKRNGFTYDSSMFGGSLAMSTATVPVWPFTLDYPPDVSDNVCDHSKCPKRSYPGLWEVPLIRQYGLDGQPCAMTDGCYLPNASADDVRMFLRQNFDRHYTTNRAPFMISLHATWFRNVPASLQGLKAFLNETNADPNVWQVTLSQMLDWVRHPLPRDRVTELKSWKKCV